MAWRQNVKLMPNKLKDDVLEDNRIKPPLLMICGKRDRRGKGKMKICPFQKARVEAESWARCCTGSQAHTLLALASTSGDLEAPM
uniref:Uncharacterized protein n=1 Tax=Oryza sativa subsp. japonica TaxID=39947 RepID=Q9FWG7_ORYSJ|nr:hypothetical protein [Oryza sativa Japonica Group]